MKILTIGSGLNVCWVDNVKWNGEKFVHQETGKSYSQYDVYAVKEGRLRSFLRCSSCGSIFPNTKAAIAKHLAQYNNEDFCKHCPHRSFRVTEPNEKAKIKYNGDGTLTVSMQAKPYCQYNYSYIGPDGNTGNCKYRYCKNATLVELTSLFSKYPNVFDTFITVDRILDVGYDEKEVCYNYDEYKLKGKRTIRAVVNRQNLVVRFKVSRNRSNYTYVRYSKRYDMLFFDDKEWKANWEFPQNFIDDVKEQIKKYY